MKNGTVTKTAAAERRSADAAMPVADVAGGHGQQQQASNNPSDSDIFHQRFYALLVLQYTAILIMASPLALIEEIQQFLEQHSTLHTVLEVIATSGIVLTMATAVIRGSTYPYAHVCLVAITLFVGLEMGLSFAETPWLFIAIAQATTSFALLLALMQFQLDWLDYPMGVFLCFVAALFWTLILIEVGSLSLMRCLLVCGSGFAFVCIVLCSTYHVQHFVAPTEHVLATLFILCPEALLCIGGASKRNIPDDAAQAAEEGELLLKEDEED